MVIGKTFAWGHIAKTGGDASLSLFQLFPELIVSADPHDSNRKHSSFYDRIDEVRGKQLYVNVRRLPSWVLSLAIHRSRYGEYPDYRPLEMWTSQQMAECQCADEFLEGVTGGHELRLSGYFRMERLGEDFLAFIQKHISVSNELRHEILNFRKVNANHYEHDVWQWFTKDQVDCLYRNNPLWTAIERRLYGGLMKAPQTESEPAIIPFSNAATFRSRAA